MIWKRIRRALEANDQGWKPIDETPIPLSAGPHLAGR